jgi:hypothetical protein
MRDKPGAEAIELVLDLEKCGAIQTYIDTGVVSVFIYQISNLGFSSPCARSCRPQECRSFRDVGTVIFKLYFYKLVIQDP